MKKVLTLIFLSIVIAVLGQTPSISTYYNETKDINIKTVQFYLDRSVKNTEVLTPVQHINQSEPLTLEFDLIGEDSPFFVAKIIPCTWDWKKLNIFDNEFLDEYNEFNITDIKASFDTRVEYSHYSFRLPKLKKSGNYILEISYDGEEDYVIRRRFSIVENLIQIKPDFTFFSGTGARSEKHLINFDILYEKYPIPNPAQNLKVVIRQNNRWDNAHFDLKPTFINEGSTKIQYKGNNKEYTFNALNEYLILDFRSIQFRGRNVSRIQNQDSVFQLSVERDEFRINDPYISYIDINGSYIIDHYEFGEGDIRADYIKTWFTIDSDSLQTGNVYLFGALTDWKLKPEFRMEYYPKHKIYACNTSLKQGYYNYSYVILDRAAQINETHLGGNHFETENEYDILVYHLTPNGRDQKLIGYYNFTVNSQN